MEGDREKIHRKHWCYGIPENTRKAIKQYLLIWTKLVR